MLIVLRRLAGASDCSVRLYLLVPLNLPHIDIRLGTAQPWGTDVSKAYTRRGHHSLYTSSLCAPFPWHANKYIHIYINIPKALVPNWREPSRIILRQFSERSLPEKQTRASLLKVCP